MVSDAAQVAVLDVRVGGIGTSAPSAFRSTFNRLRSLIFSEALLSSDLQIGDSVDASDWYIGA